MHVDVDVDANVGRRLETVDNNFPDNTVDADMINWKRK
jgi:hypothetical protein